MLGKERPATSTTILVMDFQEATSSKLTGIVASTSNDSMMRTSSAQQHSFSTSSSARKTYPRTTETGLKEQLKAQSGQRQPLSWGQFISGLAIEGRLLAVKMVGFIVQINHNSNMREIAIDVDLKFHFLEIDLHANVTLKGPSPPI